MRARRRWLRASGFLVAAILYGYGRAPAQGAIDQGVPAPLFGGAPETTPYTEAPRLLNREEVRRALESFYPKELLRAGIGGQVLVWLLLDERADLMSARVRGPSGVPALDATALRVTSRMRFTPGRLRDAPVKVWVSVPVIFSTGSGIAPAWPAAVSQPRRADARGVETPRFPDAGPPPPTSRPPSLLNGTYVFRQLKTAYEKRFGLTGERGTTTLRLRVDISGNATTAEVGSSAGNAALDSLALAFRNRLVFVPAISRGRYAEGTAELEMRFPVKEP